MKNALLVGMLLVVVGFAGTQAWSSSLDPGEPAIAVSPSTLVLSSKSNTCVSVHSNIPFRAVVRNTVEMNGLTPYALFPDSQGYLVAKFHRSDVVAIVAPPSATMTLTGALVTGVEFEASDTIVVKK